MKTIRETVMEVGAVATREILVGLLEAREKERDEAERERVKAFLIENVVGIKAWCGKANHTIEFGGGDLVKQLYPPPPPEPAKLRAGYWWWRISPEDSWVCSFQREDFKPLLREYRPWNDPPPEVTGKAEPPLPTFEEWCEKNNVYQNLDFSCCPEMVGLYNIVPRDIFDALDGANAYSGYTKSYAFRSLANAALKAALLKLGRMRP